MQFSRPLDTKPARVTRSSHHVCFTCRKTFKKPASTKSGFVVLAEQTYPCPTCQKPMTPIGKNFRAPKQSNLRAWRLAERLYQTGFRFNSSVEGNVPVHPSDLKTFLASRVQKTNAEHLLERFLDHKDAPVLPLKQHLRALCADGLGHSRATRASCSWNSTSRATRASCSWNSTSRATRASCSWNSTSRATRAVGHGRFKGRS
jgi:hypothetical protein